jgi:hypothetical protein
MAILCSTVSWRLENNKVVFFTGMNMYPQETKFINSGFWLFILSGFYIVVWIVSCKFERLFHQFGMHKFNVIIHIAYYSIFNSLRERWLVCVHRKILYLHMAEWKLLPIFWSESIKLRPLFLRSTLEKKTKDDFICSSFFFAAFWCFKIIVGGVH